MDSNKRRLSLCLCVYIMKVTLMILDCNESDENLLTHTHYTLYFKVFASGFNNPDIF